MTFTFNQNINLDWPTIYPWLIQKCRFYTRGNYDDAIELAHDTYIRFCSSNYDSTIGDPKPFLKVIVKNIWRASFHKKVDCHTIAVVSLDENNIDIPAISSQEAAVFLKEVCYLIENKLTNQQREALYTSLLSTYGDGKTNAQYIFLSRVRKRLREIADI